MSTTQEVQQRSYREQATLFFSKPANYTRLEKIVSHGPRIATIIFFFVKEFEKGSLVKTSNGGIYRTCDEYKNAITNHKKRYYNFESKEGKGEIVWKGETNPCININPALGPVSLPLPQLNAFQWLIQYGFDRLFWKRECEVTAAFMEFSTAVKRRYTEAHKSKKKDDRKRIEQFVIASRVITEQERKKALKRQRRAKARGKPGKKPVYLTRVERQKVCRLLEEERAKRRQERGARAVKRKSAADIVMCQRGASKPVIASHLNGAPISM